MRRLALTTICLGAAIAALSLSTAAAAPAYGWRVTLTSHRSGRPDAIACEAKRGCLLVGQLDPSVLAAWPVHQPPGVGALSCGALGCIGVGARPVSPILGAWRRSGNRWLPMPFQPRVRGVYGGALTSVSCVSATDCLAVGNIDAHTHVACEPNSLNLTVCETLVPVLERWDGATWTRQLFFPVPVIAQLAVPVGSEQPYSGMNAVSCASAKACTLIGYVGSGTGSSWGPDFADSWNGSSWKMTIMPSPQGTDPQLTSISCVSRGCVAVGSITVNGTSQPYAAEEYGGVWSEVLPTVAGAAALTSVSCVPNGVCFAVGYSGSGTSQQPLVERWQPGPHAGRWTTEPAQTPSDAKARGGAQLVSVSCTAATVGHAARAGIGSCAAAGEYDKQTRRLGLNVGWFVESYGPVLPVQTGP